MDSPLSEAGLRQAESAAHALRAMPLAAIYSSPLRRALETAQRIAEIHRLAVTPLAGLHELRQGVWESLRMHELEERYGVLLQEWWTNPNTLRVPGGETIEEMRERAMAALQTMVAQHRGETIAAVAHGGVNKAVLLTVLGAALTSYWRLRQVNACINVLEFGGAHSTLLVMNYTRHLVQVP